MRRCFIGIALDNKYSMAILLLIQLEIYKGCFFFFCSMKAPDFVGNTHPLSSRCNHDVGAKVFLYAEKFIVCFNRSFEF